MQRFFKVSLTHSGFIQENMGTVFIETVGIILNSLIALSFLFFVCFSSSMLSFWY